jgi:hypothetical protein
LCLWHLKYVKMFSDEAVDYPVLWHSIAELDRSTLQTLNWLFDMIQPCRFAQVITLLTCVWEAPDSNVSWNSESPNWGFLWCILSSSWQNIYWNVSVDHIDLPCLTYFTFYIDTPLHPGLKLKNSSSNGRNYKCVLNNARYLS